jgi:pimeloyl-ACP methyl ester carboxylesterase
MTDRNDGVVLLHGISRTSRSFRKMQAAVEAAGYAALNVGYASRSKALEALAEDIHPAVERFAEGREGSVHFVCHSMGGCWRASTSRGIVQNVSAAWSCSARPMAAAGSPTA